MSNKITKMARKYTNTRRSKCQKYFWVVSSKGFIAFYFISFNSKRYSDANINYVDFILQIFTKEFLFYKVFFVDIL